MKSTPTGTSLEVLAPYLPYGIDVQITHEADLAERGRLTDFVHRNTCARIEYEEDGQLIQPLAPLYRCLPILRPFSALCEPLEDGIVPAVELSKILIGGSDDEYHYEVGKSEYGGGFVVLADIDGEQVYQLDLRPDWDWWLSDYLAQANHEEITVRHPVEAINYLRSKHFAVGLGPSQFIPKATDSATLEKETAK